MSDPLAAEVTHPEDLRRRMQRFAAGEARVVVIGLGYVGLPLAQAFAERGFRVVGLDVDPAKVAQLNAGRSYIRHVGGDDLAALHAAGRFEACAEAAVIGEADAVLVCVPTPLDAERNPDLHFVLDTARMIARHLRRGQLVVLESTTYPGTTEEQVKPILEESGLRAGHDFFLAYSPEREDPGNNEYRTARIPKVVGADDPQALALAQALYGAVVVDTVPVPDTRTAEAVKLTENIFRAVNIALVNELKQIYAAMGIDVWQVIEAAKTKPFGYMPFYPGPGLGGHCIPIDPFYLAWLARRHGVPTRFIELAGEINTAMPRYVVERTLEALQARQGRGLAGARVLLVGLAYKKNIDDVRESPAFELIELLEAAGARVDYHDPYVPEIPPTRRHAALAGRPSVAWPGEALAGYDAAVVCTDHDAVDYAALVAAVPLVVDTRNAVARHGLAGDNVVKA